MSLLYIAAGLAVALLLRSLFKRFASDRIGSMAERRRSTSMVVSRGELVDGNRRMEVVLALTGTAFLYENRDLQGRVDRSTINGIEYVNELSTGQHVGSGKVLRLRCYSTTFEFVLPIETAAQWESAFPGQERSAGTTLARAV